MWVFQMQLIMTGKQLAEYLLRMAPNDDVQIGTYISGGQNNPPYLQCIDVKGLIMHKGIHDENYKILIHNAMSDQLHECIIHNPNCFKPTVPLRTVVDWENFFITS